MISIIVAIYNIESYLRRCIESIIGQTYQNLEIILVNDGSTDNSGMICDEYAGKDNRIKVIHKKNGGLSDAWNTGLAAVSGDYLGFVDGDDFIEPDMYEKMLGAIIEYQAGLAVCRFKKWGDKAVNNETTNEIYPLSRAEALEYYISENKQFVIMPSVWSKLFTRGVVEGLSFTIGKTSQDIMYTMAALCQAEKIVYLDNYLYNYNVGRNDSITNKKSTEKRLNVELEPLRKGIEYLKSRGLDELSDKAAYYFYRRMLFYFIDFKNEKQKKQARQVVKMLKEEQKKIKSVYRNSWAKVGDKVRMRIFLSCPSLYYFLVKGYNVLVLSVRLKLTE
ncbi:MAG: glycosyltransferase [Lachnospiraceae bacterium]|nr:glycosyltransferase [Lachnospiraceae bacterium]